MNQEFSIIDNNVSYFKNVWIKEEESRSNNLISLHTSHDFILVHVFSNVSINILKFDMKLIFNRITYQHF